MIVRYMFLTLQLFHLQQLSISFQLSPSRNTNLRIADNNHLKQTNYGMKTDLYSSSGSIPVGAGPLGPSELEAFHTAQFDLYLKHHAGYWKGIQTGYDPENEEVADFMYTEVNLEKNDQSTEIKHTNSYVQGEIRSDCETCFDSERLKSKEVGTYSVGKLRSRLCGNVEVRGPGITARGLSTEIIFRHGDGRVRVLLAHSPIDFMELEGVGVVPSTFILKDVVVIRERLDKRPYDLDTDPDVMWVPSTDDAFKGGYSGTRQRFTTTGLPIKEDVSFSSLPPCKVTEETENYIEDNLILTGPPAESDPEDDMFRRVLKGGILVEAPWVISADVEVRARVSWTPGSVSKDSVSAEDCKLYSAEMGIFMSTDVIAMPTGSLRLAAPRLTDFFVDELDKILELQ